MRNERSNTAVNGGFPENFTWGVASSAYQIEGAVDLRGPSIWDAFCKRRGAIRDGYSGDIACGHYERWREDVELISGLGVNAYRFSVSWPRLLPTGTGHIDPVGLGFYERLVDSLLERGTEPWVTLFHWDFPLELWHRGGWLNRDSAHWFAEYAGVVVDALSDRVRHWITLNEPQCVIGLGHYRAIHAPGVSYPRSDLLLATHHCLLAHGLAVREIRARAKRIPVIGWSPVGWVAYPDSEDADAISAARESMFAIDEKSTLWPMSNSWYSDPVVLGEYPEQGLKLFGADVPDIRAGDLEVISTPLDFYGVNIYHGIPITFPVRPGRNNSITAPQRPRGHPETLMGWTVDPQALYWGPRFLAERYDLPIYVTENGIASMDWLHADGKIHDAARIDYMTRHLIELQRGVAEGIDIRGYFHWSIMDTFEWELGYGRRFGLSYVDYETLTRTPKDSYYWYRDMIASQGRNLPRRIAALR